VIGTEKKDALIIAEAVRLVNEGVSVTFPVNGRSMLPFIVGGRDSVILEKPESLQIGDVVLAQVVSGDCENLDTAEKHYVVHRIVALNGENVTLMGDGNLALREHCNRTDVCAKVICVVKPNGKRCSMSAWHSRIAAKIWYILLPVRRYLLWIYRKVKK
jgi:hypothetical protein